MSSIRINLVQGLILTSLITTYILWLNKIMVPLLQSLISSLLHFNIGTDGGTAVATAVFLLFAYLFTRILIGSMKEGEDGI